MSKTRFAHETSALSATVAEYLLDHFEIIEEYNKKVIIARDEIKIRLREYDIPCYGETGNYLLIDFGDSNKCAEITKIMEASSIYVRSNYPKPWNSHMLITLGPIEIMDRFCQFYLKM